MTDTNIQSNLLTPSVRRDLGHLPSERQQLIRRIVDIVHEEFADSLSLARHEWKTNGAILKIILFGSYARGDWVDDVATAVGKQSDVDLLIIVSDQRLTEKIRYWANLEERLRVEYLFKHYLLAPAQLIVHSLDEVNEGLRHGRYFFMDVVRDGIVLYESDKTQLATPKEKTPSEVYRMSLDYYKQFFQMAEEFWDDYCSNMKRNRFKKAALELHQCVEQLYHTVLLVRTLYTPYVHDIVKLREQAEQVDGRLTEAWPRDTQFEIDAYERLQVAYVKARYHKHFMIDEEQLAWLGARGAILMKLVEVSCTEHLAALEAATGG
ncbi:nucleotidyltransferase domain-containing protein [Novosphingobium sp. AP12]|uniref:nucleotidyltransferase domain-containing protein n=1 Tax=Novosphingobium sp. AP12 TaxID=1144305 RepID=UPI0002721E7F|nr:nucleotidyltransferase domain-containing protein [Novosphingobium sp. AP12]EJL33763.1 putative nucleotidyltransferase [Novosphingobium sp. AP12]